MKNLLVIIFVFLVSYCNDAQVIYTQADIEVCNSKFNLAHQIHLAAMPLDEILVEIGNSFIGVNYEAHTLEKGEEEQLVVHLTGLDCYTFIEASLTFARCIVKGDTTFEAFQEELKKIRYRDGEINKYPSRLHYFSDWIFEMDKRGVVKNISKEIGGIKYTNQVNFMSSNPERYKQLENNSEFVDLMKLQEKEISSREYYYIPENNISEIEGKIQSGDIIGVTTNISGLDIAHSGIAVREKDGKIHLLHAPNVGKYIQISKKPLAEYVMDNKVQTGIMVARTVKPVTK